MGCEVGFFKWLLLHSACTQTSLLLNLHSHLLHVVGLWNCVHLDWCCCEWVIVVSLIFVLFKKALRFFSLQNKIVVLASTYRSFTVSSLLYLFVGHLVWLLQAIWSLSHTFDLAPSNIIIFSFLSYIFFQIFSDLIWIFNFDIITSSLDVKYNAKFMHQRSQNKSRTSFPNWSKTYHFHMTKLNVWTTWVCVCGTLKSGRTGWLENKTGTYSSHL